MQSMPYEIRFSETYVERFPTASAAIKFAEEIAGCCAVDILKDGQMFRRVYSWVAHVG